MQSTSSFTARTSGSERTLSHVRRVTSRTFLENKQKQQKNKQTWQPHQQQSVQSIHCGRREKAHKQRALMQERTPTIGADKSTVYARIHEPANLASSGSYWRAHGNTRINHSFFLSASRQEKRRKKKTLCQKSGRRRHSVAPSRLQTLISLTPARASKPLGHKVASMTLGNALRTSGTINKLPLVKTLILPPQYSGCRERQQERVQVGGGEAAKSNLAPPPLL